MTFEEWYSGEEIFGMTRASVVMERLDDEVETGVYSDWLQQAYNAGYDQGRECARQDFEESKCIMVDYCTGEFSIFKGDKELAVIKDSVVAGEFFEWLRSRES